MKALIVDDEKHVREAVQLLVDWEAYGIDEVLEASDGTSALALIEARRPEIIFTDMMMPAMDGCQLLSWIQTHAPSSKTIVISGHDDFHLVRHSMTANSVDYILKPIDETQLVAALKQAIALWNEENETRHEQQSRNIEVNRLKPIYWERMFTDLIQQPSQDAKKLGDIREGFPELAAVDKCACSVIVLGTADEQIQVKYNNHRDLLFFTLTNICNELLGQPRSGFAFRYWASEDEITILHWRDLEASKPLLEKMNQAFFDTLGSRFDIGLGTARPFPDGAHQAYQDAKLALKHRGGDESLLESRVYKLGEMGDHRSGEERNVIAEIQAYIENHYNEELPLQHIASTFFLSREYISRRFKQKTGMNISEYLEQIRIEKAKELLLSPSLKIAQISQMVGYHDDKYFSRVFKKQSGCTPNDYRNAHMK